MNHGCGANSLVNACLLKTASSQTQITCERWQNLWGRFRWDVGSLGSEAEEVEGLPEEPGGVCRKVGEVWV